MCYSGVCPYEDYFGDCHLPKCKTCPVEPNHHGTEEDFLWLWNADRDGEPLNDAGGTNGTDNSEN